ncbi:MAG TPA: transporter substrate-binding domain-containing protein [Burkholderiaceae bacterium]
MLKIIVGAILAMVLYLPGSSRAETVTFATTEFPPYIIKQGDHLTGFEVEFVRAICKRLGVEPEFTILPWSRALEYTKSGKVDGLLTPVYSEDRAEFIYFTEQPLGRERISIMSLPGAAIKAKSLGDLKEELVGTVLGYSYGKEFDDYRELRKVESYTNESLLKALNLGRYKVIVSDEYVINYVARQLGQADLEIVLNLKDNPKYLGFSKAIGPRGQALAKRFSQAIHDLQQDGTMDKIRKNFL